MTQKRRSLLRLTEIVAGGALLVAVAGCVDTPLGDLSVYNPFNRQGPEETEYGPTPAQQMAALKEMAAEAAQLEVAEKEQQAAQLLARLRNETDPLIRLEVVRTLGAYDVPSAYAGLRQALADANADVRIAACNSWSQVGGDEALRSLAGIVSGDTDVDVRIAAARGLAQFKDPTGYRALATALDDSNPALQHRAVMSLRTASGLDYGSDLEAWRQFAEGKNPPPPERSLADRLRFWH